MSVFLIATHIALWAAVVALAMIVLGLMRQVGTLLERVSPAGISAADSLGLKLGEFVEEIKTRTLAGEDMAIGGAREGCAQLIVFVSPLCDVCKSVTPIIARIADNGSPNIAISVAISTGEGEDISTYEAISGAALIDARDVATTFGAVDLPHVVIIREDGRLQAAEPARTIAAFEALVRPLEAATNKPEIHAQRLESLV